MVMLMARGLPLKAVPLFLSSGRGPGITSGSGVVRPRKMILPSWIWSAGSSNPNPGIGIVTWLGLIGFATVERSAGSSNAIPGIGIVTWLSLIGFVTVEREVTVDDGTFIVRTALARVVEVVTLVLLVVMVVTVSVAVPVIAVPVVPENGVVAAAGISRKVDAVVLVDEMATVEFTTEWEGMPELKG